MTHDHFIHAATEDILIVGGGPVGLLLACELHRLGATCRIIDRAPQRAQTSRATDIHARSLEVLARLGVADHLIARGKQVRGFNAYSEGRPVSSFEYEGLETRYPFTLAIPQSETEAALERRLVELGGALERRTELVELEQGGAGANVSLRRPDGSIERAAFRYVVACDGVRSAVRRLLDIPFEGVTYRQKYLVGDFDIDWQLASDQVHLFMSPDGFCNVLALPGSRTRVRILCDLPADDDRPADTASFEALFRCRAGIDVRLSNPGLGASFRIQRRLARRYRHGSVFLAGDAAHVCSPLLGQGMNTGLQDAHDLAWKLALVCRGAARTDLLDTYESDRRPIAKSVLRDTHMLHTTATMRRRLPSLVRDAVFSVVTRAGFARRLAGTRCSELSHRYAARGRGGVVARGIDALRGGIERAPAGSRLPDVTTGGAEPWWSFDLLDDTRHTLIALHGEGGVDPTAAFDRIAAEVASRFGGVVAVQRVSVATEPLARVARERWHLPWADVSGVVHRRLGAAKPTLLLVRPDGHIALRTRRLDPAVIADHLDALFTANAAGAAITTRPVAETERAMTGS